MKCLKALGLAAVAAMALTAFLGANSASATVLCTTTPPAGTACGIGWHVDEIDASLSEWSVSFRSTSGSLEAACTVATLLPVKKGPFTGSATTTPVGEVAKANLTWGPIGAGCTNTIETIAGGETEIHWIPGTDNGTVTAKGLEVTVVLAGVSCTVGLEGTKSTGDLTGGAPAIIHIGVVLFKKGGSFLCPSSVVWEGTFKITNHSAVYVRSE
jgi:hypothetical protein